MLTGLLWVVFTLPIVQVSANDSIQKKPRYAECWVMGEGFFTQPKRQRMDLGFIGRFECSSRRLLNDMELNYTGGLLQIDQQLSKSNDQFKLQLNSRANGKRMSVYMSSGFMGPLIPVLHPDAPVKNRFLEPARFEFGSGLRTLLSKGVSFEALLPSILINRKPTQNQLPDPNLESLLLRGRKSALYWSQGAILKMECIQQYGKRMGMESHLRLTLLNRFDRVGDWSVEMKCKWIISKQAQCVFVLSVKRDGPYPAQVQKDFSIRTAYIWNKP